MHTNKLQTGMARSRHRDSIGQAMCWTDHAWHASLDLARIALPNEATSDDRHASLAYKGAKMWNRISVWTVGLSYNQEGA